MHICTAENAVGFWKKSTKLWQRQIFEVTAQQKEAKAKSLQLAVSLHKESIHSALKEKKIGRIKIYKTNAVY